jgi:membrane-bound lytic murein transglycosylase D
MAIRANTLLILAVLILTVLVTPGPGGAEFADAVDADVADEGDVADAYVVADEYLFANHPEDPGGTVLLDEHPFFTRGSPAVEPPPPVIPEIVIIEDPWAEAFGAPLPPVVLKPVTPVFAEYSVDTNDRTRHFLERFTGARRSLIELWLERSGRYLGMIRGTLRHQGLPEDLAFTAMIESGFNPVAVSRAGAKGLWQFMAQTARRYGLRVDGWVDERLDPEKSTVAAAAYLRDLYNQFGSWALAQAAYNAGEMKVARAIQSVRSRDFWVLARSRHLHTETKDFVPQIQAVTLIGREPDRYGFDVTGHEPHRFEIVRVPPSTDLRRLAANARLSPESLQVLNPELYRAVTPPGSDYELKVPQGTETTVRTALTGPRPVSTSGARIAAAAIHVVRPGDTVSGIAKRYRITIDDIQRWNKLGNTDRIRPGDRLRVAGIAAR